MLHLRVRSHTLVAALTAASLLSATPALAQMSPPKPANTSSMSMMTPTLVNTNKDGLAIHGYDPVAYFTAGAPTKGVSTFSTTWNGATYHFASAANRDAFVAKPDTYAPQYGGYCAMGIAGGGKYDVDPDAWRVENGKLYLNKDKRTQTMWLRDVPGNIVKADTKWPGVVAASKK
jgi:YHS domain-containing protein